MANRLKEDKKNERLIRGLLKLSENRRCVNCNNLGPQYVCTNFWTFICTNCSGVHREFTHRVKSVSMAKFTSHEVHSLQEGGNQRAKEIYFKEWDPQRHFLPDTSNVDRLRDFIKHVYVDRVYTGERNYDKPLREKMGDKEGSRSPPYGDTRSSSGGRSPAYELDSRQYGEYKRSPTLPQIVNDWQQNDRFPNGRGSEDRISFDGNYKSDWQLPERPKDLDSSSPPVVRPVRDILGDNIVPLHISKPPKENGGSSGDGFTHTERTASSSSLGSTTGNPADVKLGSVRSLIDFDAEPEPPVLASVSQAQQIAEAYPVAEPAKAANDNNWASFDVASMSKAPQGPSNANTLDSLLSELSTPAPVSGQILGSHSHIFAAAPGGSMASSPAPNGLSFPLAGNVPVSSFTPNDGTVASVTSFSTVIPPKVPAVAPGLTTMTPTGVELPVSRANQWTNMHYHLPFNQSPGQHIIPTGPGACNNQTLNIPAISQGPLNGPVLHASQVVSNPVLQTTLSAATQPPAPEDKSSGRKELPEELFATSFAPFPPSVPGWKMGPPGHIAVPIQFNTLVPPNSLQSSKSANPFNVSNETRSVLAPMFPSMSSLQGALPNALPPSASLTPTPISNPAWVPPQPPPYGFALPPQVLSHPPAMTPTNMSYTGYQGLGGFGAEGAAFGPSNPDQHLVSRISAAPAAPAAPSPFSSAGGNPFG